MIYSLSIEEFWENWRRFSQQHQNDGHIDCVEYLRFIYINSHRQRFVRCYTNQMLHFGTTTTSRGEAGHAALKRQLGSSTGDLKTVVDDIKLLLMNEYRNHIEKLNEDKMRLLMELRKPVFQHLIVHITSVALRKIMPQYQLLTGQPTALLPCTRTFTTTTDLPCSHKIQERLFSKKQDC